MLSLSSMTTSSSSLIDPSELSDLLVPIGEDNTEKGLGVLLLLGFPNQDQKLGADPDEGAIGGFLDSDGPGPTDDDLAFISALLTAALVFLNQ